MKTGIYIHWPFCNKKCEYCDFNSFANLQIDNKAFLKSYQIEIEYFRNFSGARNISTIFFGGGTPSLMKKDEIDFILQTIYNNFDVDRNVEITVECNPEDITKEKMKIFAESDVNRISIGVQSFIQKELEFLSRIHSVELIHTAIRTAKEYFKNISIDIIYSLPNQNLQDIEFNISQIEKFDPNHVSMYTLMIKENTEFYKKYQKQLLRPQDIDIEAKMFEFVVNRMSTIGYNQYEVSSFAKKGFECMHNKIYWQSNDFIPIGCGAHGRLTVDNIRYEIINEPSPHKWMNKIYNEKNATILCKEISDYDRILEKLSMGLRLSNNWIILTSDDMMYINHEKLSKIKKFGLINVSNNKLKITQKGLLLCDFITREITKGAHK